MRKISAHKAFPYNLSSLSARGDIFFEKNRTYMCVLKILYYLCSVISNK